METDLANAQFHPRNRKIRVVCCGFPCEWNRFEMKGSWVLDAEDAGSGVTDLQGFSLSGSVGFVAAKCEDVVRTAA